MTTAASSSDTSYRQSLNQALHASRILTGALDDELGIQKTASTTKLGSQHQAGNQAALHATLSDRLRNAISAWDELASVHLHTDPEVATGDLAIFLLSRIHVYLSEKKRDLDSKVAIQDEHVPGLKGKGIQPKEDVGLGIKDVKLVTTLQSLASRWALSRRIKAYDQSLFTLAPKGFASAQSKTGSVKLTPHNRFEEVNEDAEVQERTHARAAFTHARQDLYSVVDKWMTILMAQTSTSTPGAFMSASTDVVTVILRVGIIDYLSSLLRLGFGPNTSSEASVPVAPGSAPVKDAVQKRAAAATTQLLKFLSTHSAMSALSSVIAHSDHQAATPSFVKSASSRFLSAQLLRPDGVRSLFIITFGGADLADSLEPNGADGKSEGTGTAPPGTNSLKRFEQCARLLLTPPLGMPVNVYMPIVLPNLFDILAPNLDPSSHITPPPQEQMRAAGFVLTRISERHPQLFASAVHDRVYSKFRPSLPTSAEAAAGAELDPVIVTSSMDLDRAVSTLSSFLLFSEPSPIFFTALFEPILPQLLTLYGVLHAPKQPAGKGKVRSLEAGGQRDRLKAEVSNFLRTWVRLVDAKHGATSLIRSFRDAETGIGYRPERDNIGVASDDDDRIDEASSFFWSEEENGVSIRYGQNPDAGEQDISSLLKDLSLAALAKQISEGHDDEVDLTKITPDLSAKLGLQPDPQLVATLLKAVDRKDLASLLLPSVLDFYMAQKTASRAHMLNGDGGAGLETRSVLYLQLILQLFNAFGSDLLQGDIQATLAFIDFSLSSPSQRRLPVQQEPPSTPTKKLKDDADDSIPFISAKSASSQSASPSLLNLAGSSAESRLLGEEKPAHKPADQGADVEEEDEDEEELVSTALSLLLSLLEADTTLSTESQPMLVVIADKFDPLLDSQSSEIRSLAKEAKLVLMARRNSIRGAAPAAQSAESMKASETSIKARAYVYAQETYQEALKLLQDPILPVRAHGLVLLRRLVSDDPKAGGQNVEQVDPALVPAILDIFLHAVQDEESYLYLNAVQGLAALVSSGGSQTISRLVGIYIGREDGLLSQGLPAREVEKRLRVGEALLQVIQRCGEAMPAHVDVIVPLLLAKLRDRALPNVLRSSFISILGTVVEAAPLAMASKGYASQLAEICLDIVVLELVQRPGAPRRGPVKLNVQGKPVSNANEDDDEKAELEAAQQRKLDSATVTDSKVAHLRRAAMLLLTLLVRGTRFQLEEQLDGDAGGRLVENLSALRLPGGGTLPSIATATQNAEERSKRMEKKDLLFPPHLLRRVKEVAGYVEASDIDAVVRAHAHDCVQHVDALSLSIVQTDLSLAR